VGVRQCVFFLICSRQRFFTARDNWIISSGGAQAGEGEDTIGALLGACGRNNFLTKQPRILF
jgi:hypothetical protein